MKILLIGEYSNLHHTLGEALRRAGHDVLVISDGDGWKDYPRDVDLRRTRPGLRGSVAYGWRLLRLLGGLRGFDVVQLINPVFLDLKAAWNVRVFDYLHRHNGQVVVGLFGDDAQVVGQMQSHGFLEYTDFHVKGESLLHTLNRARLDTWTSPARVRLTRHVVSHADKLVACLYEYYKAYDTPDYVGKLHYAPLPIDLTDAPSVAPKDFAERKVRILMGIQKRRGLMKGTDQMRPLFERLATEYPDRVELDCVESLPFDEYCRRLSAADILVDQLYSYTPAMNALEAMKRGIIVVSGGEEEAYRFIGENTLRPIINLRPMEPERNYQTLASLIVSPRDLARLSAESIAYVRRHHDARRVAQQYVQIYESSL